ncbi:FG-GAP-like repeat-containing protein [Haliangium sp.]|uniref:FG-GAP-like repeat-containing protein n=1 Tax=Haliangium sp. TaxID=2663208 RepID=UPI003D0A9D83
MTLTPRTAFHRIRCAGSRLGALAAAGLVLAQAPAAWAQITPSAPTTTANGSFNAGTLDSVTQTRAGVAFNGTALELAHAHDSTSNQSQATAAPIAGAAADFTGDGMDDLIAGFDDGRTAVLRNDTTAAAPPVAAAPAPNFTAIVPDLQAADGNTQVVLAAADFDGDGDPDVLRIAGATGATPTVAELYLLTTRADPPTFAAATNALAAPALPSTLGTLDTQSGGTSVAVGDLNGDNRIDFLFGNADGTGGEIRLWINTGSSPPTFHDQGPVLSNLGFGAGEAPVFAYADFDSDGRGDLVVGAPGSTTLRLFKGNEDGTFFDTGLTLSLGAAGAAGVAAADLSHDGVPDLVVSTDTRGGTGGQVMWFENDRSTVPFSTSVAIPDAAPLLSDADLVVAINYDSNPTASPSADHSVDVLVTQVGGSLELFSNILSSNYVSCGEVVSDVIDFGAAPYGLPFTTTMVISAARMQTLVGGSGTVELFMSTSEDPTWVPTFDCDGAGPGTEQCARFPHTRGRELRWKARMCTAAAASTPALFAVSVRFDYVEDSEHYLSGISVFDGVAYFGGFTQPGDVGQLYALSADLNPTADPAFDYWSGRIKLDTMADAARNVYTAARDGTTRLDFATTNSGNAQLQEILSVADSTAADAIINWARDYRFGPLGLSFTRLGSIFRSTPTPVGRPLFPAWYARASSDARLEFDEHANGLGARTVLIYYGARDGMIHATYNDATDITNSQNGQEAWAYIPPPVASRMAADFTASSGIFDRIQAYPDSDTLVETVRIGADLRSVALFTSGTGGSSIAALDITATIDEGTSAVLGPTPLWHATPGASEAGLGLSRPTIARVLIGGNERFIAIAGTGYGADPVRPSGRVVAAYDVTDGTLLWRFMARCAVTTHITAFETNDEPGAGNPQLDGFMDRVVFGDQCGYVYKLDPAQDLSGGWNGNPNFGAIPTDLVDGVQMFALFATSAQPEAGNLELPIAGNIAVRAIPDQATATTRSALFFGTGGIESADPFNQNVFFVLFADDTTLDTPPGPPFTAAPARVASFFRGVCAADLRCEKFYGGITLTGGQVVFTRVLDPPVGDTAGVGSDPGQTIVQAIDVTALLDASFDADDPLFDLDSFGVSYTVGAASFSPVTMYGDAVYVLTSLGRAEVMGTPRAQQAGQDSSGNALTATTTDPEGIVNIEAPMRILGWQQVY